MHVKLHVNAKRVFPRNTPLQMINDNSSIFFSKSEAKKDIKCMIWKAIF